MVSRQRCRVPSLGMIRGARLLLDIVRGSIDESKLPYARNTAKHRGDEAQCTTPTLRCVQKWTELATLEEYRNSISAPSHGSHR
jgi:hypothetical protein